MLDFFPNDPDLAAIGALSYMGTPLLDTDGTLLGQRVTKDFTIRVDEPYELCGANQFANPQEYLLAALNACMIVGYSAVCAL